MIFSKSPILPDQSRFSMRKPIFIFLTLFCVCFIAQAQEINIYFTNNNNGTLENCYCPDHPLGSIEKRSKFINDLRLKNPDFLLFDSGDFFSVSKRNAFKDSLVAEAYAITGYDGITLGDQELSRDEEFLSKILPKTNSTIILSNISHDVPFDFRTHKIYKVNDINILVMGVINSDVFKYYPETVRNNIQLDDPAEAINEITKELYEEVDLVVVLSHQGYEKDLEMTAKLKNVDIIIGSHTQTVIEKPEKTNGVFVIQGGKEGYYLGKILVSFDEDWDKDISGELIPMSLEMPNDPRIEQLIKIYEDNSGYINPRKKDLRGINHGSDH